jgi:DNA repair exonuclease SbcCD nuclease subunit
MNVIWTSDLHFGLKTDGVDRNEEIYQVALKAVKHACSLSKKDKDVIMVFGGDIFNTNDPDEEQINYFTKLLAYLHKYKVKTFVMSGNHDATFSRERTTCLRFVENLNILSPHIELVSDIGYIKYKDTDLGPIYFTFLPHVGKTHYHNAVFKSPQDYVNKKCEEIADKIGRGTQHYIFSHLNVKGVHPGSEENLLNKSEVYLPDVFVSRNPKSDSPRIIQGHIHSASTEGNINIVGSPIYCTFGEDTTLDKCYLHLVIPEMFGNKEEWNAIRTDCTIFNQVELDLTNVDWSKSDFLELDEVRAITNFKEDRKYHLKFDITVNAENCSVNWDQVKLKLEENKNVLVKPIVPKFIKTKMVRVKEQKLGLQPIEAIKVFLKTNKPKRAKEKFALAKKYMGGVE